MFCSYQIWSVHAFFIIKAYQFFEFCSSSKCLLDISGKEMVDYIADYLENIRDRRVFPDVQPGYMRDLISDSPPIEGENWEAIFRDVDRVIMPGVMSENILQYFIVRFSTTYFFQVTHWQSPHMHAYFPALNSYPSLLGDMLANGINCLGFTWVSSLLSKD